MRRRSDECCLIGQPPHTATGWKDERMKINRRTRGVHRSATVPGSNGLMGGDQVRTVEVVATLSLATDLATGVPLEHGLHSALIARRLAVCLGTDAKTAAGGLLHLLAVLHRLHGNGADGGSCLRRRRCVDDVRRPLPLRQPAPQGGRPGSRLGTPGRTGMGARRTTGTRSAATGPSVPGSGCNGLRRGADAVRAARTPGRPGSDVRARRRPLGREGSSATTSRRGHSPLHAHRARGA